uniref:Zinc finger C-x8-C-x5-C-x3-H type (And similar)/Zinc finger, C3HC4 type (RING finger)/zinc-RING finger domain containing protein, putative n=1 Tax=Theileria annulata TaxID=5874 RepID=A0A3B0MK66_THEAN
MFNKRNLSALKNRKPEELDDNEESELKLNPSGNVKLFKKRTISKICVTSNQTNPNEKKDLIPSDSNIVDLLSSDEPINRATSTYEIDTDRSMDHRSILERNLEIGNKILSGELEPNIYRGKGAYKPVINVKKDSIAASKYTGLYGPVRASATNVRTTLRIDYQPDICKDYKETGYCGFGDTCKFLHDRSDYKSGWQLEKEWEEEQAKKRLKMQKKLDKWHKKMQSSSKAGDNDKEEEESEDLDDSDSSCSDSDDSESSESCCEEVDEKVKKLFKFKAKGLKIPFCCLSCKKLWKTDMNPVVTSCGHYFCERCIIEAYSTDMKCPKCKVAQDGIMNKAGAVEKLLESMNTSET